jgi:hypothetical protein
MSKYHSYATDAFDEFSTTLKQLKKYGLNKTYVDDLGAKGRVIANRLPSIIKDIQESIKFKIPDNGQLLPFNNQESTKRTLNKFLTDIHLPYKKIILEFDISDIVLNSVVDNLPPDFLKNSKKSSLGCLFLLTEHEDYISLSEFFLDDGGWMLASMDYIRLDKNLFEFYENEHGIFEKSFETEIKERIIVNFLCALSCGNAAICDDDLKPSTIKEKLRKDKRKPPFFSYKVLTINTGATTSKSIGASYSHNSPRVHLRRGHIRKLPTKNIWVNACIVGDKSKGIIHKDYSVI